MSTSIEASRFDVRSGDGTRLAVWVEGNGPPLVMVHGSIADHTTFDPFVEVLRRDVTTYAMDRRGFGASGDTPDYAIERDFEDVAAVVDAVAKRTGGPVPLWGHSYGANCAMGAATLTGKVSRLVLYEPSLGITYPAGSIEAAEQALADGDPGRAIVSVLVDILEMTDEEVAAMRASPLWPVRLAAAPTVPRECRAEERWRYEPGQFAGITAPTLLLSGSASPPLVQRATEDAAAAISDSRIEVLRGRGHFAHKTDPELVWAIVHRFVASASRGSMTQPAPNLASTTSPEVRLYDATYGEFDLDARRRVRLETYGEDIGQNGWLTAEEWRAAIEQLAIARGSRVLDVACGSGGPALELARTTGATVVGVDVNRHAIKTARGLAQREGLAAVARYEEADAARPLPFPDGSFDAVVCIDAINHLPDRRAVLADWHRLLRPGGSVLFTDPIVVTGLLTSEEIALRASIGFFVFSLLGENERLVREAGFELVACADSTENVVAVTRRWRDARARHRSELLGDEGEVTFEGLQRFLSVAHTLARERRLSRYTLLARRVAGTRQNARNEVIG